jgi:hypothetical protein
LRGVNNEKAPDILPGLLIDRMIFAPADARFKSSHDRRSG